MKLAGSRFRHSPNSAITERLCGRDSLRSNRPHALPILVERLPRGTSSALVNRCNSDLNSRVVRTKNHFSDNEGQNSPSAFWPIEPRFVPVIMFWVFLNENPMRLMKWFGLDVQSPEGLIFGAAFLVTFGLLVASNVLVLFWLASAGLVLFIYLGSLILVVAEFTMRRIAEYPKGPILAGSVALGSITALIKAFW
jgi:hypothetical protein